MKLLHKAVVAAGVFVALSLFYQWDLRRANTEALEAARAERIIDFGVDDTDAVTLTNTSGVFELQRRQKDWWLVKPVEMLADADQVTALVENVRGAKKYASFRTADLKQYGLDKPESTIVLREKGGKECRVSFGSQPGQFGRTYARVGDSDEIFTVGDWVKNQAARDLEVLRDKRLLRFDEGKLRGIVLHRPADRVELVRKGGDTWTMGGGSTPGDSQLVHHLLTSFSTGKAIAIVDKPTTSTLELGLDPPLVTMTLIDEAGGKATFELGRKISTRDEFYCRSSTQPGVLVGRGSIVGDLLRPHAEWTTKQFIWMDRGDFRTISTESGKSRMVIELRDNQWQFQDAPGIPMHPGKLADFLKEIDEAAAVQLISQDVPTSETMVRYGLTRPSLSLTVTDANGSKEGFIIGTVETSKELAYVERLQDHSVWGIDFRKATDYYKFRSDLQDRRLQPDLRQRTTRLEFLGKGTRLDIHRAGDLWKMSIDGGKTLVVPVQELTAFLDAASNLEWEQQTLRPAGKEPVMRINFFDDGGKEPIFYLEVVDRTDQGGTVISTSTGDFVADRTSFKVFDDSIVRMSEATSEEKK